jgi:hypothetical protein
LLLEILFVDDSQNDGNSDNTSSSLAENYENRTRLVTIDLDTKHIPILQMQINGFKEERVNPAIIRAIAIASDRKLCIQCA